MRHISNNKILFNCRWPDVSIWMKFIGLLIAMSLSGFFANMAHGSGTEGGNIPLLITYPLNGTLFPRDIVAPTVHWTDSSGAGFWHILVKFKDSELLIEADTDKPNWRPPADQWGKIKELCLNKPALITISGVKDKATVSRGHVEIETSEDPVTSPVFYREVRLPVAEATRNPQLTRWRIGYVSSEERPRVVLQGLKICANCHAFTPDGRTLGMDVDTDNDKGAYIIADVSKDIVFSKDKVMTWNSFNPQEKVTSFGLFSQFSPDGRYVVSTVKEFPVLSLMPDIGYSQLFFPVRGMIAVYDRRTKEFFSLPGADDPDYVQTNPVFSPDGKWIVFALAKAIKGNVDPKIFLNGSALFQYDLYRIPFNDGKGGKAEPLLGASDNNRSNYFPKFTPDGKWIIFTQSESFMIIQPDAELHIISASGGSDRKMKSNTQGKMASWHSVSPNGRWMVFSSKANGPYTQLWLTHLDREGNDSPPVLLEGFTDMNRAANIPEFLNISAGTIDRIIDRLEN